MATINLGAIKFNWRGAYNNATAYAVDDVVSSSGSSYICILASTGNAVSNGTYWQQMSAAGTNGTDLTTTLTTQGDLVYRDGSGLQRLGAGTSGQVLQTGGAGANPSWGTVSSDFVRVGHSELSSSATTITMSNVFTTTYDIYHVNFQFQMDTTSQVYMQLEKSSDGSFQNANYYFNSNMATRSTSGSAVGNQGEFNYGNFRAHENQTSNPTHNALWHLKIVRPMDALQTRWSHHISQYDDTNARDLVGGGWNANSEAHSGFKLVTTSGNMRAGSSVSIYGLKTS